MVFKTIREYRTKQLVRSSLTRGIAFDRQAATAAQQRTTQKKQRWKMRGPTGKLEIGLRKLESEVRMLENQKTKRYAITAFFAGMGMTEVGAIPFVAALVKGAQARTKLEQYLETHKNYPRVMNYLAARTTNAYLKKIFERRATEEIRLRQIIRGPEKLKLKLQLNLERDQMNPREAINNAFNWGIEQGLIKQRKGETQ